MLISRIVSVCGAARQNGARTRRDWAGGLAGMAKLDLGTAATLVGFFLIGLFAGGQLRGNQMETVTMTAAIAEDVSRAPGEPPTTAAGAAKPAGALSTEERRDAVSAPAQRERGADEPKLSLATSGTGGAAKGDDDSAPAGNRYAGLESSLEKLPLPREALPHDQPVPNSIAQLLRNESSQPVLPEVFMPCCAKTGTTFLWGCTTLAFRPSIVCGSNDARKWTNAQCGDKRYVLPGGRVLPSGCRFDRKEYFFWGGGKGDDKKHIHRRGMYWYAGMPTPLYYWQRNARACFKRADVEKLCYENLPDVDYSMIERPKSKVEIVPEDGRIHPACRKLKLRGLQRLRPGRPAGEEPPPRIQLEVESYLPWVDRRRYPGAVSMDFTPNHMNDPMAPIRLWDHMPHPERLRFVVSLRNPLKRAYSEWSMFIKWNWERVTNFGEKLRMELDALRKCNSSVYDEPSLILTLPHTDFSEYHAKCITGSAMEYVRNSMYVVGFRNWMRVFKAEQILVIYSEVRPSAAAAAAPRCRAARAPLLFRPPLLLPPAASTASPSCAAGHAHSSLCPRAPRMHAASPANPPPHRSQPPPSPRPLPLPLRTRTLARRTCKSCRRRICSRRLRTSPD
jgi:hypothetical protein